MKSSMGQVLRTAMLVVMLLLLPGMVQADQKKRWSVSPMLGVEGPRLRLLNDGEFRAPLPGRGRLTLEGTGDNINFDFIVNNRLDPIDWGSTVGLEFQLLLNQRNSLLFGFSIWEGSSTSSVNTEIPFQGVLTPTTYKRSGKVSYFEYYVGWKRNLLVRPRKYNIYSRLSLRELFDVDYKEKFVFSFQGGPSESFKRVIVTESQATGILLLELGLGAEYFISDWVSIGGDAGYSLGFSKFELGDASKRDDLQPDDNIQFKLPAILDNKGKLQYLRNAAAFSDDLSYEANNYRPLKLEFDGWRAFLRVNFYF